MHTKLMVFKPMVIWLIDIYFESLCLKELTFVFVCDYDNLFMTMATLLYTVIIVQIHNDNIFFCFAFLILLFLTCFCNAL